MLNQNLEPIELNRHIEKQLWKRPLTRHVSTFCIQRHNQSLVVLINCHAKRLHFQSYVNVKLDNPLPNDFVVSDSFMTWTKLCDQLGGQVAAEDMYAGFHCLPSPMPFQAPSLKQMQYGFGISVRESGFSCLEIAVAKAAEIIVSIMGQAKRRESQHSYLSRKTMLHYYRMQQQIRKTNFRRNA